MNKSNILITGANGFIGRNLGIRLCEQSGVEVSSFVRGDSLEVLRKQVTVADAVVHLAGENRPSDVAAFGDNIELTRELCLAIQGAGRNIPIIFASSTHAEYGTPYGQSKLAAESVIETFANNTANSAVIYRLVGVFGKFCRPNYNSVVATFCHNIARGLPVQVSDPDVVLELAYIDDVVDELLQALTVVNPGLSWGELSHTYKISVGDLAEKISSFDNCRTSLRSERVGTGLTRALYATYISHLPKRRFVYDLTPHVDERGMFIEMLKTPDCGQFSFFTVVPGVTRGSHYHHTKTEKFLVVKGEVVMNFRNLITNEACEINLSSDKPQVVDTIPGWVHDITNTGNSDALVMLWANEIFDEQNPDCVPCEV